MRIERCLALFVTLALAAPVATAEVKPSQPAPELDKGTKDTAGKVVSLKSLRKKKVVLTFCAAWAGRPCKEALTAQDALAEKLGAKVVFLVLVIDEDRDRADKFISSLSLPHLRFAYAPSESNTTTTSYEPPVIPIAYAIDSKGVVRFVQQGFHAGDDATLEEQLRKMR